MLTINEPIGRFIALANLEKNMLPSKSIEQDISNLIDLICLRIKHEPIETVANSLLESMFNLRMEIMAWLANNDKPLDWYLSVLDQHIVANIQLSPFSILAETVSLVLLKYKEILLPVLETQPQSFDEIINSMYVNKPRYDTFRIFDIHPSPQIKYFKKWLDATLQLEAGIILADLILTNQIQFPKKRIIPELTEFLLNTIIKFGAYSIFTQVWNPGVDDTSNLTNSMKILSATIELDNRQFYHKTTKSELFNMVND